MSFVQVLLTVQPAKIFLLIVFIDIHVRWLWAWGILNCAYDINRETEHIFGTGAPRSTQSGERIASSLLLYKV